jgi:ABC-type amino acid transport system permease subunit
MSRVVKFKFLWAVAVVGLATHADSVFACAACYGSAKGPLMDGLQWGVFALLASITIVLGVVASFFVYLAKKSANVPDITSPGDLPAATQKA